MVIATAAVSAVSGSAKEDGSIVNSLLKLAVVAVIFVILAYLAVWAYFIIINWEYISQFFSVLMTFLGGGGIGLLNPFKGLTWAPNDVVNDVIIPAEMGEPISTPTGGGFFAKSLYWFTQGVFGSR